MNKKIVVICCIIAVVLLGAIGYVFYNLIDGHSDSRNVINDSRIDVLNAVPSDAILLCDFNSLNDVNPLLLAPSPSFTKFLSFLPDKAQEWGSVFSLHYSGKNQVSLLFVSSLPKSLNKEEFVDLLRKRCVGVTNKQYNGIKVYKSASPDISFAVYNNFLLASSSVIILESSLRHLENKSSILDNTLFASVYSKSRGNASMHIYHQNIGKFFSGAINKPYLGYASFVSHFADWTMFDIIQEPNLLQGSGQSLCQKGESDYAYIFSLYKSSRSYVSEILPYNINYVVSLPLPEFQRYVAGYKSYLDANKKIKDYIYINFLATQNNDMGVKTMEWLSSLGIKEIALSSIPVGKADEKVLLMKVDNVSAMKNANKEVNKYLFKGYVSAVLGDFFSLPNEDYYCVLSDWVAVGSSSAMTYLSKENAKVDFYSLDQYLSNTPAAQDPNENSSLKLIMNLSSCKDSIAAIFKNKYYDSVDEKTADLNFKFLTSRLYNEGGKVKISFKLILDNFREVPKMDDSPIVIPKGPFVVKNYLNGKKNYFQQMPDNKIRLLDENKKGVWTVSFGEPVCGYVEQIDYLNNNKLQMIFAAGSKIYLMDRLGRIVSPFPIDIKHNITLGPAVYDISSRKDYSLMILTADNMVRMYDVKGEPISGWNIITTTEKIKSLPSLFKMGDKDYYWVLRTSYQTLIYNKNGVVAADFSKKRQLSPDTQIKVLSSSEVAVTTIDGKEISLNLATGTFKKL